MTNKRITLFAGHYGSGKTNLAVNYALHQKSNGLPVCIADLDIVNPYFRTKDSEKVLAAAGIKLISPAFANSNVDLPALPQELYSVVEDRDTAAVLDIGGDDRGALALGRYAPYILRENDYEMVFVVNFYRPLTATPAAALEVLMEIEAAGGIPFTAIVNNSNLGNETEPETVRKTDDNALELSRLSGLPLLFTSAKADVEQKLKTSGFNGELFPLNLQEKYFDIREI